MIESVASTWPIVDTPASANKKTESATGPETSPGGGMKLEGPTLSQENLPAPFQTLPTIEAQQLICFLLPRVLPPVLESLSDWKVGV